MLLLRDPSSASLSSISPLMASRYVFAERHSWTHGEDSPLLQTTVHAYPRRVRFAPGVEYDSGTERDDVYEAEDVSGWRLFWVLVFPWLGSFLVALDTTMTSNMSTSISQNFDSLALIGWLSAAYLLASTAVQPLSGKLTDILGRRPGLLFCCVAFIEGNLVCGLATSTPMILIGRVITGVGGGGINSICTFVASDMIPARRKDLWQGLGMVIYAAGLGLGSVLGGVISDTLGWRWAFLWLCPPAAVIAIGVFFAVPASLPHLPSETRSFGARIRRVDFAGSILLVAGLAALLFTLDSTALLVALGSGARQGPSTHTAGIALDISRVLFGACALTAGMLFLLFALQESNTPQPILGNALLGKRSVTCACLTLGCASASMATLMIHEPVFFTVMGKSNTVTGALMLPEAAGFATGCIWASYSMHIVGNYIYTKPLALVIFLVGAGGFSAATWETPLWVLEIYLFANGLGFSAMLTIFMAGMMAAIEFKTQAVATGAMYTFRAIGAVVGISSSSVLFRVVLDWKAGRGRHGLGSLPGHGCRGAAGTDAAALCKQYELGLQAAFLVAFGFAVAALVFGLFMPNTKLESSFGEQSGAAETEEGL